ncbi:MAG TPA: PAS domain-containing sensor histidine kinase [Pyrinomonadaceae bacterium]|nr:PAS domain-containing sensor histidine kinase [Pyrinomonadaceae bacterium]
MHSAAMLTKILEEREAGLFEVVDQLRLAAEAGNVGMWLRDLEGRIVWANGRATELWGFDRGAAVTQTAFLNHTHPDDREPLQRFFREISLGSRDDQVEYRIVNKRGEMRWLRSQGTVDVIGGEKFIRGAVVDVTDLKRSEQAVRALSHKLLDAQQKERERLAFELQEGLNQDIALLSLNLAQLKAQPGSIKKVTETLDSLVTAVQSLSTDVHRISYELHPTRLSRLPLDAAIRGVCNEFSSRFGIDVELECEGSPHGLSQDVSLCVYRIAEESLENIAKHSGATKVRAALRFEPDAVRFTVIDNGKGFDVDSAHSSGGLGLPSIDERVRFLGGHLSVVSAPGEGSRIDADVPVGNLPDQLM